MLERHPDSSKVTVAGSLAAAQSLLAAAHEDGASILPCGRGSRMHRNLPHAKPDRWLSLAGLQEMVWLDAEDQTCEAQAGMTVTGLQSQLAPHGLQLEVDTPGEDHATLGGLFQAREINLLEGSCGPLRDQVLGGNWLLSDGTVVKTGARVVKSVAGYDVTRLFLGARGRLAICLSLILRLAPVPTVHWYRGAKTDLASRRSEARYCIPLEGGDVLLGLVGRTLPAAQGQAVPTSEAEDLRDAYLERAGSGDLDPPLPPDSPWLQDLAEACAPGVPHLGGHR